MAGPSYYLWKPAQSPLAVELNLALIERLTAATKAAGSQYENRLTEIGGLLLGSETAENSIQIDDFEELTSEHRRGASFELSPRDRLNLMRRLQAHQRAGRSVVGYFRTHS